MRVIKTISGWNSLESLLERENNSEILERVSVLFLLNPVFLAAQLIESIRAPSVEGVSIIMIIGFGGLNILTGAVAVKANNLPLYIAAWMSFFICLATTIVVLVRQF